jgi:hypothetical protein
MLQITQKPQYLKFLASYKAGNRFNYGTPEYNQILMLESLDPNWTKSTRLSNGIDVPTLTYIETMTTQEIAPRGIKTEQLFSVATQPQVLNVGLPAGTTPTTTTPDQTNESFISRYKMPLIIGAIAIGYMLLKKK